MSLHTRQDLWFSELKSSEEIALRACTAGVMLTEGEKDDAKEEEEVERERGEGEAKRGGPSQEESCLDEGEEKRREIAELDIGENGFDPAFLKIEKPEDERAVVADKRLLRKTPRS